MKFMTLSSFAALASISTFTSAGLANETASGNNPSCMISFSAGTTFQDSSAVEICIESLRAAGTVTGIEIVGYASADGAARTNMILSESRASNVLARLAVAFPSAVVNARGAGASAEQGKVVLVTGYVTRIISSSVTPPQPPVIPQAPTYKIIPPAQQYAIDNFQYTDPFLRNPDLPSTADLVDETEV